MSRRAFTILELMIALALIVTLAALVMPSIGRLVHSTEVETTARNVESMLTMARADAQRDGQAIVVYAQSRMDGLIGLYSQVFDPRQEMGQDRRPPVLLTLPKGMSFSSTPPEQKGLGEFMGPDDGLDRPVDDVAGGGGEFEPGQLLGIGGPDRLELVIFLPDGSGLGRGSRYLHVVEGRGFELVLNQWTGAVTLAELSVELAAFGDDVLDRDFGDSDQVPAQGEDR